MLLEKITEEIRKTYAMETDTELRIPRNQTMNLSLNKEFVSLVRLVLQLFYLGALATTTKTETNRLNNQNNSYTLFFFYKNLFYKNVEAGFCRKFKNITQAESQLRTIFIPTKCF